ncbi:MAG: hypothetical protein ACRDCK_06175, partial [Plesiomonas shigelloides]
MMKVKPDASLYPEIKDEVHWVKWDRELITIARAQGVANVLSGTYHPTSHAEYQNWYVQNTFMFMVFQKKVLFATGKAVVRTYHKTSNAQATYQGLKKLCEKSTKAKVHLSNLNIDLHTMRLTSTYSKPYTEFIMDYTRRIEEYNELQLIEDAVITQNAAKILLETAVAGVPVLDNVRTMDLHLITATGKEPATFPEYTTLLLSAASVADEKRIPSRQRVNMTELIDDADDETPSGEYELYRVQRGNSGGKGRLDDVTWKAMPLEARRQWTEIPLDTRIMILEAKAGPTDGNKARQVNMTDVTDNYTERETLPVGDNANQEDGQEVVDTPREANQAHAGDPRRVMADKKKKDNVKRIANTTHIVPPTNPQPPPFISNPHITGEHENECLGERKSSIFALEMEHEEDA